MPECRWANPAPSVDDILCLCSKRPLTADINEVQGVKWWFSMNEVTSLWAFVPPSSPDPFSNVTKNGLEQIILWIVQCHNLSLQLWRTDTRGWGDEDYLLLVTMSAVLSFCLMYKWVIKFILSNYVQIVVRDIYTTVFSFVSCSEYKPTYFHFHLEFCWCHKWPLFISLLVCGH